MSENLIFWAKKKGSENGVENRLEIKGERKKMGKSMSRQNKETEKDKQLSLTGYMLIGNETRR